MPEPEAELQATANLSPVSPSPVHTAAPLVVPALQDTVDTIDAMVAAAAASEPSQGVAENQQQQQPITSETPVDPEMTAAGSHGDNVNDEDINDDDSFGDPYSSEEQAQATEAAPVEQPVDSDDYAKTFDSPINPEEDVEMEDEVAQRQGEHRAEVDGPKQQSSSSDTSVSAPAPYSSTHDSATQAASRDQTDTRPSGTTGGTLPTPDPKPLSEGQASAEADDPNQHTRASSADIQQLVADLSAQSNEEEAKSNTMVASQPTPATALPTPASLPPRPPQPNEVSPSLPSHHHPGGPLAATVQIPAYGAPGDALNTYTPGASPIAQNHPGHSADRHGDDYQRQWEQFVSDERQYMSEAKWDRFPEGSRIFIGNLSSDKVSKRDVFDIFHKFGKLAQISLKSAYGFVQYHTVDEGRRAIDNMEGSEVKGRRIHLEVSRLQDKGKKDRPRSPDNKNRGREANYRHDRYSGSRDNTRSREHSPRRDGYGRERNYYDGGRSRGRSRSPSYGRNDKDSYRRRSPSPRGRGHHEDLDLPRRYGPAVPDVQLILQPEVNRDFVNWVESVFKNRALKTEVMYLHPRFPKDQVIQRQAVEGVHAIVDLDIRAQQLGKIPVQAFDRSAGAHNVRFDQYVDLDPQTAVEVILRAKASASAPAPPAYGQPPPIGYGAPVAGYPQYGAQAQQAPHTNYPVQPPAAYSAPQAPPASVADLQALLGQVDPATLQQVLSGMQQAQPQHQQMHPAQGIPPTNPAIDIQALLGSLNGKPAAPPAAPPQGQYGQLYPPQGQPSNGQAPPGDQAAQVQKIMAQLSRYR